eukprot:SAG22_NODE_587_length_8857_cov_5.973167_2_plen_57_part_00
MAVVSPAVEVPAAVVRQAPGRVRRAVRLDRRLRLRRRLRRRLLRRLRRRLLKRWGY